MLQVSDQLVEINGHSTAGMTHSQAVEQIRTAGQRIHLILKKGNGYVPDYGKADQTLARATVLTKHKHIKADMPDLFSILVTAHLSGRNQKKNSAYLKRLVV